jgi:hypothetical protein
MKTNDVAADETALLVLLGEKSVAENTTAGEKPVKLDAEGKIVFPTTQQPGTNYECASYAAHINAAVVKKFLKYGRGVSDKCKLNCQAAADNFLSFVNYTKVAQSFDKVEKFIAILSDKVGVLTDCEELSILKNIVAPVKKLVQKGIDAVAGIAKTPVVATTTTAPTPAAKIGKKK